MKQRKHLNRRYPSAVMLLLALSLNICVQQSGYAKSCHFTGEDPCGASSLYPDTRPGSGKPYYRYTNQSSGVDVCVYESARVSERKLNWNEADKFCKDLGGALVNLGDMYFKKYVMDHRHKKNERYKEPWVGAKICKGNTRYCWLDDKEINDLEIYHYVRHKVYKPDECLIIFATKWLNTNKCSRENFWICELRTTDYQKDLKLELKPFLQSYISNQEIKVICRSRSFKADVRLKITTKAGRSYTATATGHRNYAGTMGEVGVLSGFSKAPVTEQIGVRCFAWYHIELTVRLPLHLNQGKMTCCTDEKKCDEVVMSIHDCPVGKYGPLCKKSCSSHCAGAGHPCNREDGSCDKGCMPGWTGPRCDKECPDGKYGLNCKETCSGHCKGGNRYCSHVDGACKNGCDKGWAGPRCDSDTYTLIAKMVVGGMTSEKDGKFDVVGCDNINGTCTGNLGPIGQLELVVEQSSGNAKWSRIQGEKNITSFARISKYEDSVDEVLGATLKVVLELYVTRKMAAATYACVVKATKRSVRDELRGKLRIITGSLPPRLAVKDVDPAERDSFLELTCDTQVGDSDGMTWELLDHKGNKYFWLITEATVTGGVVGTSIYQAELISHTKKAPCGLQLRTFFKVDLSELRHGATVTCISYNVQKQFTSTYSEERLRVSYRLLGGGFTDIDVSDDLLKWILLAALILAGLIILGTVCYCCCAPPVAAAGVDDDSRTRTRQTKTSQSGDQTMSTDWRTMDRSLDRSIDTTSDFSKRSSRDSNFTT